MKSLADDWNEIIDFFDSDKRIALGIFILALVAFSYFHGGAGWNQDATFDLTRALVERGTVSIDGYSANTGDISPGRGGHVYINKPPGLSLLATIPYAIVYAARHVPLPPGEGGRRPGEGRGEYDSRIGAAPHPPSGHLLPEGEGSETARVDQWITTAATCGVCGALIGVVLFLHGRRRLGASARDSLAVALVILFGTIVFPYATMLFAHVPPALFMLLAVVWMRDRPLLAGMAAGLATICFYVCAPAALVLVLITRSRRMVAGGAPFAILLGAYHWLCFGSPFRTALEVSTPFTEKGLLFGVLRLPRADALYGLTLSPYRGLFFASPVLFLAFVGAKRMWRGRVLRDDLYAVGGCVAIYFLVISAFNQWNGGWAFGPRYLLPIVPLFGIPMLAAMPLQSRRARALFLAAALVSIATNFLATAVDPMPPPGVDNPIADYLAPAFFTGEISELTMAAVPWFHDTHVKPVALATDSGNLGELAFSEASRASLIPIALWMLAGTAVLTSAASKRA